VRAAVVVNAPLAVARVARRPSRRSSGSAACGSPARTSRLAAGRGARAADASRPVGRCNRTPSRGTSGCVREPAGRAGAGGNTSSDRRAAPRPSAPPSGPSSAGSHWAGTRRGHRRVRTRKPHEELRADNRQAAGGRGRRERRRARPRRGRSNSYIPIYEYIGASDLCRAAAVIIPDPDETSPGIASRSVARGRRSLRRRVANPRARDGHPWGSAPGSGGARMAATFATTSTHTSCWCLAIREP